MNKIFLFLLGVIMPLGLFSQDLEMAYNPDEGEIGIFERLDTYVPLDIEVINELGQKVKLEQLVDKPTVIALVYYRCPGICSPFMESMAEVVYRSDLVIGEDYQILSISFDPREGPELARQNRNNYHHLIKKDIDPNGWQFFVADSANIARITQAVGFRYKRTGFDFLHTSAMIFMTPDGKLTRYLHGTYFLPIDLKMAVIETAEGKSGPSLSRVLSYCYTFDPAGQQYVLNITKVSGTIILFFALVILLFLVIKPKKRKA
ncbi:MAG: SCO family protein [Bacteroidales bacterium]|jgi:protein SCO1/2|nr:SCO family protein [Bacteroidales bacterium]NLM93373.1 SCO family protein [Bacteroidales bacterium]